MRYIRYYIFIHVFCKSKKSVFPWQSVQYHHCIAQKIQDQHLNVTFQYWLVQNIYNTLIYFMPSFEIVNTFF